MKRTLYFLLLMVLVLPAMGQKKGTKQTARHAPDKTLMQEIWDAWSTLDPGNAAKFYAKGPHVFFDIAPLKYGSWTSTRPE